ncbi:MAG TPA: SDR family NAD(P)-dependent oxidoreductase [Burkholderiales bacterium]|jgi:NAD(P)-dependent dehydrogenase (short-subunit alcohol dehydrogenase family)|nr:SDR family NAD(P)-dependent oxidoreductase [Burkholderiales bacterium]
MRLLEGRVAIVTGGARGIGRAIVEEFLREGARVVLADNGASISGETTEEAAVESVAAALGAVAFTEDVAAPGAAQRLTRLALERFGALDIVVNNAAILRDAFIFKARREDFERVIAVNLTAPFALLAAATPAMREQAKQGRAPGRIVNIVSSAGLIGNFGQSAYAASKAGLFGLTRVVAMDMARSKVACNAIAPFAATRVTESIQPANEEQARYKSRALRVPAGHVARVVAFLASNAHEVSGQLFGVRARELFVFSQPRPAARAEVADANPWDGRVLGRIIERDLARAFADLRTDLELFNTEPLI